MLRAVTSVNTTIPWVVAEVVVVVVEVNLVSVRKFNELLKISQEKKIFWLRMENKLDSSFSNCKGKVDLSWR